MRPTQKPNRSRGRGNRKGGGGGGGGGNNINRVYDSSGPEGKVRGTPQQIIDKYVSLGRDAQTSGDRVAAENFLQHAEHYQRILIQAAAVQDQARRDATEAATDQPSQQQHGQGGAAAPAQQNQPRNEPRPAAAGPVEAATPAIGGMTMIDAGPGEDTLVVDTTEAEQGQPRRNGDGRRRRPKTPAADGTPEDTEEKTAQPEAQAEG